MKQFLESPDFLQTVIAETEKNSDEAKRLVEGLSEGQLSWTSNPQSWSIAQCLDHLAVSGEKFSSYFNDAIDRGGRKWPVTAPVPYRPTLLGGLLIKQVVPEAKRKFPAPKILRPSQSQAIPGVVEKFLDQQNRFLDYVRQAKGLDYNKTRMRSPVTPLMRYSLADAFVVIVVHTQRHLGQARRMRETAGFPAK